MKTEEADLKEIEQEERKSRIEFIRKTAKKARCWPPEKIYAAFMQTDYEGRKLSEYIETFEQYVEYLKTEYEAFIAQNKNEK